MDFFAHQERARGRTWLLIGYFVLAVIFIIALLSSLIIITALFSGETLSSLDYGMPIFVSVGGVVLAIISLGTLWRLFQLRGGGRKLAKLLKAKKIAAHTQDVRERRLVNVAEEMSIAAGMSAPEIYVLEREAQINAFVAGYTPTESILVVTRGALEQLSREELQGVIAHEYSHIFHGDMRLNLRLMAIIAGIMIIGEIGFFIMRSATEGDDIRAILAMLLIGALIVAIGYIGVFCGSVLKAAISRQREFLADASAVQYTRNPQGLANALRKVGSHGSKLKGLFTDEVSHMCFGQNGKMLLATHPPLEERIRRLERQARQQHAAPPPAFDAIEALASLSKAQTLTPLDETAVSALVANPEARHLSYAQQVQAAIPEQIKALLHQPEQCKRVIYALLLSHKQVAPRQWLEALQQAESANLTMQVMELQKQLDTLGERLRLPLLDLALPALRELEMPQRRALLKTARILIDADKQLSLFEHLVYTALEKYLDPRAGHIDKIKYKRMASLRRPLNVLLSALTHAGSDAAAQQHVLKRLQLGGMALLPPAECDGHALRPALGSLRYASPKLKSRILDACVMCIQYDGKLSSAESEILRIIADSLDAPLPPLL